MTEEDDNANGNDNANNIYGNDDDALAQKLGTVRTVNIKHTVTGETAVREEIHIEGYPSGATTTLMVDMTTAFVSILCQHTPRGEATRALLGSFMPAALREIENYEKRNHIEPEANNLLSSLMTQMAMGRRNES